MALPNSRGWVSYLTPAVENAPAAEPDSQPSQQSDLTEDDMVSCTTEFAQVVVKALSEKYGFDEADALKHLELETVSDIDAGTVVTGATDDSPPPFVLVEAPAAEPEPVAPKVSKLNVKGNRHGVVATFDGMCERVFKIPDGVDLEDKNQVEEWWVKWDCLNIKYTVGEIEGNNRTWTEQSYSDPSMERRNVNINPVEQERIQEIIGFDEYIQEPEYKFPDSAEIFSFDELEDEIGDRCDLSQMYAEDDMEQPQLTNFDPGTLLVM